MSEATYWNGERCRARKVRVVVADAPEFPRYWARGLVGEERDAVEVDYRGDVFYLDDEEFTGAEPYEFGGARVEAVPGSAGWAWQKVTAGRGSPMYGHRSLTVVPGSVEER